jgi:ADP-L-glycero-D-manno-heptose 6-epimerase
MIIVTGAAGFVGSNVVRALNDAGRRDVVAVDDLTDGDRFRNLADCEIADYLDRDEFRALVRRGLPGMDVEAILHQGACADTTESDGRYMMDVNYAYSKEILHAALERRAALVYASSASVYGLARHCVEEPACERPLNVYAYSKWQFDNYVRRLMPSLPEGVTVVGLRYFNVYGPREAHKGRMASMVWQLHRQLAETGVAWLFAGTDGYADGEQRRDFVSVADVAAVNLHFGIDGPPRRAIVNVGSGEARSFNDVARALIARLGRGRVEYVPFPDALRGKYQSFTRADLANLRAAGYERPFLTLEQGIDHMLAEGPGAGVQGSSGKAA